MKTPPAVMKFTFPNLPTWEKLISRWSELDGSPEKKLICAVIALAIVDVKDELYRVSNKVGFFGENFEAYCRLIHVNPDFLREQIKIAGDHHEALVLVES